jgi:hypothetical protein
MSTGRWKLFVPGHVMPELSPLTLDGVRRLAIANEVDCWLQYEYLKAIWQLTGCTVVLD